MTLIQEYLGLPELCSIQTVIMGSVLSAAKHGSSRADRSSDKKDTYRHDIKKQLRHDSFTLAESQKVLIKKTWKPMEKDMAYIGKLVFLKIFEGRPEIKALFPFKDCEGDELMSHQAFVNHAYR